MSLRKLIQEEVRKQLSLVEERRLEKAFIYYYTGYRHNRYDGYASTWGVLSALGASPTADTFAGEDDYPDDEFDKNFDGKGKFGMGDNTEFRLAVLENLDISKRELQEIKNLDEGETFEHSEYWGPYYEIKIVFKRIGRDVIVDFNGEESFIAEF
ncbi:MAG: hypothetical protein ACOCWG_03515 [bacterium]